MVSRSTAPAHCASGRDSIGRHCSCCPISSSAWAGWSTYSLLLIGCLRLEDPHLLVEAVGDRLVGVQGGVVSLDLHALELGHRLLLIGGRLVAGLDRHLLDAVVVFELDAGDVGVDVQVELLDR